MILYLDAEYTNDNDKPSKRSYNDIIQVGYYIPLKDFEECVLVKPNHQINSRISDLTGITKTQLKLKGCSLDSMVEKLYKVIKEYEIGQIYVYGNLDKRNFESNIKYLKSDENEVKFKQIIKLFKDIKPDIEHKVKLEGVSLELLAYLFGVEVEKTHNALCDAKVLSQIQTKIFKHYIIPEDRLKQVKMFYKFRQVDNCLNNARHTLYDSGYKHSEMIDYIIKYLNDSLKRTTFETFLETGKYHKIK